MKPLFTLILLLLTSCTAMLAGNPELWVNGTQVTEDNSNDILGEGTVHYDQERLSSLRPAGSPRLSKRRKEESILS